LIPSEREVADVLDSLHVAWLYEPRLFVLEADEAGLCRVGFRPDFYLLKYDLYIEVTKCKQSLVTRKNHKARLLRELYPDERVVIIYRRDFPRLRERVLSILQEARDDPSRAA
jgi:hypothetical protein